MLWTQDLSRFLWERLDTRILVKYNDSEKNEIWTDFQSQIPWPLLNFEAPSGVPLDLDVGLINYGSDFQILDFRFRRTHKEGKYPFITKWSRSVWKNYHVFNLALQRNLTTEVSSTNSPCLMLLTTGTMWLKIVQGEDPKEW